MSSSFLLTVENLIEGTVQSGGLPNDLLSPWPPTFTSDTAQPTSTHMVHSLFLQKNAAAAYWVSSQQHMSQSSPVEQQTAQPTLQLLQTYIEDRNAAKAQQVALTLQQKCLQGVSKKVRSQIHFLQGEALALDLILDAACTCYQDAVLVDATNIAAWKRLLTSGMLTNAEEDELLKKATFAPEDLWIKTLLTAMSRRDAFKIFHPSSSSSVACPPYLSCGDTDQWVHQLTPQTSVLRGNAYRYQLVSLARAAIWTSNESTARVILQRILSEDPTDTDARILFFLSLEPDTEEGKQRLIQEQNGIADLSLQEKYLLQGLVQRHLDEDSMSEAIESFSFAVMYSPFEPLVWNALLSTLTSQMQAQADQLRLSSLLPSDATLSSLTYSISRKIARFFPGFPTLLMHHAQRCMTLANSKKLDDERRSQQGLLPIVSFDCEEDTGMHWITEARASVRLAKLLAPTDPDVLWGSGLYSLRAEKRPSAALYELQKAVDGYQKPPASLYSDLGCACLEERQVLDGALAFFRGLAQNCNHTDCWLGLSRLYRQTGNSPAAEACCAIGGSVSSFSSLKEECIQTIQQFLIAAETPPIEELSSRRHLRFKFGSAGRMEIYERIGQMLALFSAPLTSEENNSCPTF